MIRKKITIKAGKEDFYGKYVRLTSGIHNLTPIQSRIFVELMKHGPEIESEKAKKIIFDKFNINALNFANHRCALRKKKVIDVDQGNITIKDKFHIPSSQDMELIIKMEVA